MKFVVRATEASLLDAMEAASWYESRQPGLGTDFQAEVQAVAKSLGEDAMLHRIRFSDVRRAGLRRFSGYGLFYFVRGLEVTVFAIIHGARNPAWVRRRRNHLG